MSSTRKSESPAYRRYRRRRISTLRLTVRIAALTVVATLVIGAGIAWQLAQGRDPALGSKAQAATSSSASTTDSTASSGSTSSSDSASSGDSSSDSSSSSSYPSVASSSYSTPSPAAVTSSTS
jgi:cytoskeletal protein RodZ